MFQLNFTSILLVWSMFLGVLNAHTVPTLVVEAEFTTGKNASLKVNLDPRLFLSVPPSSLPPVPASWWFDQDENSKAESIKKAGSYIDKILTFRVGETIMNGTWQITPIDSVSAFPLVTSSAEVHLLAEYTSSLSNTDGVFTLEVSKDCPVGLILVNSLEGVDERKPQSLFAGETSLGFTLPARIHPKGKNSLFIWLGILTLPLFLAALRLWKR